MKLAFRDVNRGNYMIIFSLSGQKHYNSNNEEG
jgi:hypothetical protein